MVRSEGAQVFAGSIGARGAQQRRQVVVFELDQHLEAKNEADVMVIAVV